MSGHTVSTVLEETKQSIRRRPVPIVVAGIIALLVVVATLRLFAPFALWTYNVERAGHLMDEGISWPEPRQVDSLPEVSNNSALDEALGHLSAAMRWRPEHFHAYRLAGIVYAARHDWARAADALEQAHERAPENPMPAWEAGLMYEQMVHTVEEAPTTPLTDVMANGAIEAPAETIETPFCADGRPETCYVGETTFAQPYAGGASDDAPAIDASTVFMHPPARVRLTREIPAEQSALRFLVGLDPAARDWATDGATFQIWVEPQRGQSELVYQRTVDGATAVQGWVAGWADLSPWAGEEVTLVFGVGPNGDGAGDWFGWGDVALTTVEAGRYWAEVPAEKLREVWGAAGFVDDLRLGLRANRAFSRGDYSSAYNWYSRKQVLTEQQLSSDNFRLAVSSVVSTGQFPHSVNDTLSAYTLTDNVQIEAELLQWVRSDSNWNLEYGDRLVDHTPDTRPNVGIMWWTGAAVVFVEVSENAHYWIRLRAQDPPPGPTKIQLEKDFTHVAHFTLSKGDNRWHTLEASTFLTAGIHLIGVRYLEDSGDAVLDWIQLEVQG